MIICDLCIHLYNNECELGLKLAKGMSCRDFCPGIEKFCSNPADFVNARQVVEMATFFGMKGTEVKKVKVMAAKEDNARAELLASGSSH